MRAAPVHCSNPLERVRAETHRGHEDGDGRERDVQRLPVELAAAAADVAAETKTVASTT